MNKFGEVIGDVIKRRRKELGLTAEELANKVGIDRTYLSKMERHNITPSLLIVARIIKVLGLSSDIDSVIKTSKNTLNESKEIVKFVKKLSDDFKDYTVKQSSIWRQIVVGDENSDKIFVVGLIKEERKGAVLLRHIQHWRKTYNKFLAEYLKSETKIRKETEV